MLLNETLELVRKLIDKCDVDNIEILLSDEYLHCPEEEKCEPEFDLRIKETLYHSQIQRIDEVLSEYSNVEMRMSSDGLEIYEVEA